MACTEAFADVQDFIHFWCAGCAEAEGQEMMEYYLDAAAGNIHAAMAAVNACDCTLAVWAPAFLKKINLIEAGTLVQCRCVNTNLTVEEKRLWLEWADRQLDLIRTSKIDVCAGATAGDWPSIGWASQSLTDRAAAEIIANAIQKGE